MRKRLALFVGSAFLLSGCALLTFRLYWERPNAGLPEFEQDSRGCITAATSGRTVGDEGLYKACMRSKGWQRVTVANPSANQFRGPEEPGQLAYPPDPREGQRR